MSWTCPQCGFVFKFHGGPPSSGGPLSCFTNEAAERMYQDKDGCCFQTWWHGIFGAFVQK